MSYTLLIVESPAKCKKIESYLGEGYKCVASFGHLRELKGLDSININENFKPTFIQSESKLKQIGVLRKMISGAKEVLLASDDDREGEAIAWHICDIFNLSIPKCLITLNHAGYPSALGDCTRRTLSGCRGPSGFSQRSIMEFPSAFSEPPNLKPLLSVELNV